MAHSSFLRGLAAPAALLALAAPAGAHHSSAQYATDKRATLSGTVKAFDWRNPHCWITLTVPNANGGTDDWRLEGGSVSILVRNGWSSKIVVPGDKVKMLISPRKDATPGGEFYTILEKNGQKLNLYNTSGAG